MSNAEPPKTTPASLSADCKADKASRVPAITRMKNGLLTPLLLVLLSSTALGGEQAGPNPKNLSPLGPHASSGKQAGPSPTNPSAAGSQGVSLFTGAFTYSYPIVVPPGRRGIQPDLTLLYNSQAQNGWVGLGWNLSLISIQRSTLNGIPSYNDTKDTFILQYQGATSNLVPIGTGTDTNGSYTEYREQIESAFLRVRYYGISSSTSSWIITDKNGIQYQLQGLGQNTNNNQFFYWGLTEEFDPLGNFMTVSYPNLASATSTGAPGPGGTPTAIQSTGAVVGYMPASISYTGKCTAVTCQTVTQNPLDQITFSYEMRPDTITSSMVGGEQVITTRLQSIQTTSDGNPVRTYELSYSSSMLGTSLLGSIALIGSDSVTALSTATFSYEGSASYSVTLSTSYQLPVYFSSAVLVDVNGDNLPDLVENVSGVGSGAWLNTGNGWISSSTWIPPVPMLDQYGEDLGIRFADINGDGLVDILQGSSVPVYGAWLNNGSGWSVTSSTWNPPVIFVSTFVGSGVFTNGVLLEDVNGDGLPDLLQQMWWQITVDSEILNHGNWLDTGSGWGTNISTWTNEFVVPFYEVYCIGVNCHQIDNGVRFADLNNDGLVDEVYAYWNLGLYTEGWLNNGKGWNQFSQWNSPAPFVSINSVHTSWTDSGLRFVDINGDGFPDLVQYSSSPVAVHIWLNTGNGWLEDDSFAPSISSITATVLEYVDLNGDGVPDIIAISTNPASPDKVYLGSSTPSNVLTMVNNGIGGVTQISYTFSPPPVGPLHLPPVTVVQSMTVSDGISGDAVITSSYAFAGGLFDNTRPYREFLGFQQATVTDAQGNQTITQYLQNQNAISGVNFYKGIVSAQYNYDVLGDTLAYSTNTVSYATPFSGVYFPFISETDSHLGNKESAVGYAYDTYGNLAREEDYGDVTITGDERTITIAYSASTGPYLVGYPVTEQIFSGLGTTGPLLSRTSYYYDASYTTAPVLGELTKTDRLLAGGQDPVVISSYDAYGNITDTYDAVYNATGGTQGNHVHTIYETTFNQFPASVQQAVDSSLSFPSETFTYDPGSGQMLSHVDVNGSTTTYAYDVFDRLSTMVGPADQVTPSSPTASYQYNLSTTPPQSIVSTARVVQGSTITLVTYTFFDGQGRKIETKTSGPAGNQIISGAVVFNNLGLAATSYNPISLPVSSSFVAFSSTQPHLTTTYDGLGRVVEIVFPDNTISTKAYQGWTETDTDANGHSKTYVKDAYSQIIQVDEQFSTTTFVTTYQYDLRGDLTNIVNSLNQGTTIYYDTLSRKTEMSDPQMGTWEYAYDTNGNLIQQTDAKNQTFAMTYDPLNREISKVYPDSTTLSYLYDSGRFGIGKLSEVIDLSGTTQFTYDSQGDILSKMRTIGGTSYTTSMTYDDLSRETSVIYPDWVTVNEVYDASALSLVQSTTLSSYAALSYSTATPTKISNVLYGNGMSANYAYDPNMSRLTSLRALAYGTTIQNFGYQYDGVGNMSQITDAIGPMTQTFLYDPLDRISQASGTYGTNTYQYDSVGNLTFNSDNTSGFWGFDDTSTVTSVQGVVVSSNGRIGNGLSFNGASEATINGSSGVSPPATITISLWVRPLALGSGYIVSKSTSYAFPQIESNGSIDATLQLSSGQQVVHVSSAPLFNLWNYFVLTYDGANIAVYVNGQLWASQSASGTIQTSTQAIVLGSGFTGSLDELSIYPWALSASEVLQRYQLYPSLALNQPFTPNSVPGGMTVGAINSTYTFTFTAWDLNGNNLDYRIDWGTGSYQDIGYVPSGTVVQATHAWTSAGQYNVRMESVEASTTSSWSPSLNIFLSTPIQAALNSSFLIGASANVGTLSTSSRTIANTVGEALTGVSSSTLTIGYLGYQGATTAPSSWTPLYLGQQGPGGTDAPPTPELPASNLVTIQYTTSSADVSTIALNLLEHGTTMFVDANGNLQVENGRWIAYDFENRPVRIVTQDATLIQFAYDFQGNRTQQTITPLNQSSQTTTYVGGIYETTSTGTIKYIAAGPLLTAMQDQSGNVTYFLPDHLGSTNLLVNSSLSSVRNTRYMPFGSTFETSGSLDNAHKFTGQRLDGNTGLYYYGARYYDPLSGRFITPDPSIQNLYDPQNLNRYVYCRNNPLIYTDPTGNSLFSTFVGDVSSFFNHSAKNFVERPFSVLASDFVELNQPLYNFTYKYRYYIAAAAIIAVTGGAFVAAAPGTLALSISQGALYGEIAGAVDAGLQGGNAQTFLSDTLEGGVFGAIAGAAGFAINSTLSDSRLVSVNVNALADLQALVVLPPLGGALNVLENKSFIQGVGNAVTILSYSDALQVLTGDFVGVQINP